MNTKYQLIKWTSFERKNRNSRNMKKCTFLPRILGKIGDHWINSDILTGFIIVYNITVHNTTSNGVTGFKVSKW